MGNSGSVHHMQSGLKELHSYYQVQGNAGGVDDLAFLAEEQRSQQHEEYKCLEQKKSLPRSSKFSRIPSPSATTSATKNVQVKVLPNLSQQLRLRSTTNGAILQSGGTISIRRESFPLPQSMVRSKTFIHDSPSGGEGLCGGSQMRPIIMRRSQTQLSINLKKSPTSNAVSRGPLKENGAHYNRYSLSNSLKESTDILDAEQVASVSNSSETNQMMSKVKIKNKKRKAPPIPPADVGNVAAGSQKPLNFSHKNLERKQRMFKTKSETGFQAGTDSHSSPQAVTEAKSPSIQAKVPLRSKPIHRTANTEAAGFRREKSFDATLLSWRDKDTEYQATGQENCTSSAKRKSLQLSVARILRSKSGSKPEKSDFKSELEAATSCRAVSKSIDLTELRTSSKAAAARQREPTTSSSRIKIPQKTQTQSKIPQLKKTFYFGMEGTKQEKDDPIQKPKKSTAEEVFAQLNAEEDEVTCGPSDATVYTVGQKYSSEINDNGIHVNVRPTLPRRQLEIPIFSPIAAWRTLTEEYRKNLVEVAESLPSSNSVVEAENSALMEERIIRTCREPCPFYSDNKSGDSGISGDDAYLPEKPIQPRNLIHFQNESDDLHGLGMHDGSPVDESSQPLKVVGPFLTPWTPQQDLDEEDTSSDGDMAIKILESRSPISAHVFSLSLPRENQISLYGEKSKPEFRSLQKLKRFASGEFSTTVYECTQSSTGDSNAYSNSCLDNYRSDNWLLSKAGTIPTNHHANDKSAPLTSNQTSSPNKPILMDWSAFIQSMSINCLATGKHLMYLPNRPTQEPKRQSVHLLDSQKTSLDDSNSKNTPARNKRFSFQSSVRQIERRQLAEILSKEAEKKEALRKSELEVMRRVEEEFQRKRAYEKASIRHQLRLYSMDDDNFSSLPADYAAHCNTYRADPDGAVSSTSDSPVLNA